MAAIGGGIDVIIISLGSCVVVLGGGLLLGRY
jgi:hypothetical protein